MSSILIDNENAEGAFSFSVTMDESVKPAVITISGVLTADKYFEEITKIENDRYILRNVHVFQESFGSDDNTYGYAFTAGSYIRKAGSNG